MRVFLILVFLVGLGMDEAPRSFAASETVYSPASGANPLDAENPFARSVALGSAFVGVADDGTALFSNPAGLAWLPFPQVLSETDFWLVDSFQQTLLWAFPLAPHWGLGLAGRYLGFGSLPGYDAAGTATEDYGVGRLNLNAGAGWEFLPDWAIGLEMEMDWDRLDQSTTSDLTWGLGILGRLSPWVKIGAGFQHDPLAVTPGEVLFSQTQIGTSVLWPLDVRQSFLTVLSATAETEGDWLLQGGAEYAWSKTFFLRVGCREPLQDSETGGLSGLTAGAGAKIGDLRVDYAYSPYGDLGNAHRITVGFDFPPPRPTSTPRPKPVDWPSPPETPPAPVEVTPTPRPQGDSLTVQSPVSVDPIAAGQDLEKEGKYPQAMELYQFFLKGQPSNPALWEAMGRLYARDHESRNAAVCFRRALALKPGDPVLLEWLQSVGER